jgi:hypothetical protein
MTPAASEDSSSNTAGRPVLPSRLDARAVGLFLCPNRNLTTLTAAILSLHPNVQVLNHGFERLRAEGLLKFLHSGRDGDLEDFVRTAITMSCWGRRGDHGGSILLSHAYDRSPLRAAYAQRYGDAKLKPEIHCLIWKDGARLREFIKAEGIDPVSLAERLPRLRFISPLRHPIAHLRSLQRYYALDPQDYVRPSLPDLELESVARYLLTAHEDFLGWRRRRPSQFVTFVEDDLGSRAAVRLLDFLGLATDPAWECAAAKFFLNDGPRVEAAPERACFEFLLLREYPRSDELRRWYTHVMDGTVYSAT